MKKMFATLICFLFSSVFSAEKSPMPIAPATTPEPQNNMPVKRKYSKDDLYALNPSKSKKKELDPQCIPGILLLKNNLNSENKPEKK